MTLHQSFIETPVGVMRAIASDDAFAKQVGSPDASRAVGMANGANPIAIIVPCHRVIGSNGMLTGYGGGLEKKSWLLNHERRWAREPPAPSPHPLTSNLLKKCP